MTTLLDPKKKKINYITSSRKCNLRYFLVVSRSHHIWVVGPP